VNSDAKTDATPERGNAWCSYKGVALCPIATTLGPIPPEERGPNSISASSYQVPRTGGEDGDPLSLRAVHHCRTLSSTRLSAMPSG
jgi:hypothetical protein